MRKSNKKGFTIVELVIVIAVIAILAAVLIPTFAGLIQKANESKDTQLVKNLNTALAADNKEHKTMTDALDAAVAFGYDVGKINASATGNEILWDSENDVFCYLKGENVEYIPETNLKSGSKPADYKLWKIYDKASDVPATQKYSIYWNSNENFTQPLTVGFDAGNNTAITTLKYERPTGASQTVTIRTNGGTLEVNAPADNVNRYGKADSVKITAVASASYHEFGEVVGNIEIIKGRLELAASANVSTVLVSSVAANDVKIDVVSGAQIGTVAPTTESAKTDVEAATTIPSESKVVDVVTVNNNFAGGLGTERSPYLISNYKELGYVSNVSGLTYYKLINDIKNTFINDYIRYDKASAIEAYIDLNNYKITSKKGFLIAQSNHVSFKNGTIEATGSSVLFLQNSAQVYLEKVLVSLPKGTYAITTNADTTNEDLTVNVKDCEVNSNKYGFALQGAGNYTITGTKIKAPVVGITIAGGNLVVDNCEITSTMSYGTTYNSKSATINFITNNSVVGFGDPIVIADRKGSGYNLKSVSIKNTKLISECSASKLAEQGVYGLRIVDCENNDKPQAKFTLENITYSQNLVDINRTFTVAGTYSGENWNTSYTCVWIGND